MTDDAETEYFLNEKQALLICMLAETPMAAEMRKAMVDVIHAVRHGQPVPPEALRTIDQLLTAAGQPRSIPREVDR